MSLFNRTLDEDKETASKFSPKRAKAVALGKVIYCIMDGTETVFSTKNLFVAIQQADLLQKANPNINYTMIVTEVK